MTPSSEISRQFCPYCGAWMDVHMDHWRCEVRERERLDALPGSDRVEPVDVA